MTPIANKNADLLANLSVGFIIFNDFTPSEEVIVATHNTVMNALNKWYTEHGRTLDVYHEELDMEAVQYAYSVAQSIADIAKMMAMTVAPCEEN